MANQPGATRNDVLLALVLASVIFVSRLPFLDAGYGTDPDAWRVVKAARTISLTGDYTVSRFPGYPLHEILVSLVWRGGPWAVNGLSAFFAAVGTGFFCVTLKKLGHPHYITATLATAFTPIIFTHSTTSMDYLWALGFILMSLHCVVVQRFSFAGALLGLAVGCRVTSLLMMIPFILHIRSFNKDGNPSKDILKFAITASLITLLMFFPVILTYGPSFLTVYEKTYPSFLSIAKRASIGVWGPLGVVGLVVGCIMMSGCLRTRAKGSLLYKSKLPFISSWLVGIVLYLFVFFMLPGDPAYLIPIVPMVIIIFGTCLNSRASLLVSYLLVLSPFVFGVHTEEKDGKTKVRSGALQFTLADRTVSLSVSKGPILEDYLQRVKHIQYLEKIISRSKTFQEPTIIVAGTWLPALEVLAPSNTSLLVTYISLADSSEIQKFLITGKKVYALKGQQEYIKSVYNYDLERLGVHQILESEKQGE